MCDYVELMFHYFNIANRMITFITGHCDDFIEVRTV